MAKVCPKCDGMGMVVVRRADGRVAAEACDCQLDRRVATLLERARIPERYRNCTLKTFERGNRTLDSAFIMADRFVSEYPFGTEGQGLLLTGRMGVGKTHLAVGLIHALITEKSVPCLFCDYRELLKHIQESYNPSTHVTELQVLRPVFDAEVLLIDDLGYIRPTDWVWDTVALILNRRYNSKKTTIITTNYANRPAGYRPPRKSKKPMDPNSQKNNSELDEHEVSGSSSERDTKSQDETDAENAMREETLGDRIGERMRSRLAEMCVEVHLKGTDLRQTTKRANFGRATPRFAADFSPFDK